MPDDVDRRVRALEDQWAIHDLAARFSDVVNERDVAAFGSLWATEGATWIIGEPLPLQAEGRAAITGMLEGLFAIEHYFMQLTHSGVVTLDGDVATARFDIREHGRGEGTYYDNLAVYNDELVREDGVWRFRKRSYSYRFLDQQPFSGTAFPVQTH